MSVFTLAYLERFYCKKNTCWISPRPLATRFP